MSEEIESEAPPNYKVLLENTVRELFGNGTSHIAIAVIAEDQAHFCTLGDDYRIIGLLHWVNTMLAKRLGGQ